MWKRMRWFTRVFEHSNIILLCVRASCKSIIYHIAPQYCLFMQKLYAFFICSPTHTHTYTHLIFEIDKVNLLETLQNSISMIIRLLLLLKINSFAHLITIKYCVCWKRNSMVDSYYRFSSTYLNPIVRCDCNNRFD